MAHLGKTYDLDQQCLFVPLRWGHIDGSCDGDGDSSGGEPFPVEVPVHQNPKPGRVYQCHNPDQRQITTCVCVCVCVYCITCIMSPTARIAVRYSFGRPEGSL